MRQFLFFILLAFSVNALYGQEKCATELLPSNTHFKQANPQFERWLGSILQEKDRQFSNLRNQAEVYVLPVVVHIIHKGEPLGSGTNIPTDQILKQIEILNNDYRRKNADSSQTFQQFKSVAADTEIEFRLATRDPEGLPTDGIVRIQGSRNSYSNRDVGLLSSTSYWPSEDYINIWVTDFGSGLLGFAQFPVSNIVGLDVDRESNPLTDGVYIDYEYFGAGFNTDDFSQGRTATHEIGHFLGLRHIWGDGGCTADDYCNDTPTQERSTKGCPTTPSLSCNTNDMNQNYMDYTDDACMNIFTFCQKNRMRAVIQNSPRRKSLLSSRALEIVEVANLDLGIRKIVSVFKDDCSSEIEPKIEIRNYGNSTIQNYIVSWQLNGQNMQSLTMTNANMQFGDIKSINFNPVVLPSNGEYTINFKIESVNSIQDANAANNLISTKIRYNLPLQGIIAADFETTTDWHIRNSVSMSVVDAPTEIANNKALSFNFYQTSEPLGTISVFESPLIRVSPLADPRLEFRYAYKHNGNNNADGLFVKVSTDCGVTYPNDNLVFSSYGSGLNSVSRIVPDKFIPESGLEWRTANINLTRFANAENIRIAVEGQNGGGNNLYIDDIKIDSGPVPKYDLVISSASTTNHILCNQEANFEVTLLNNGTTTLKNVSLSYSINGGTKNTNVLQFDSIAQFRSKSFPITVNNIPANTLAKIDFEANIIGNQDEVLSNNFKTSYVYFDNNELSLPYRNSPPANDWFNFNKEGEQKWVSAEGFYSVGLFNNVQLGREYWLVSPLFDASNYRVLGFGFDYAYANRNSRNDQLEVRVDVNCEGSFEHVVYEGVGRQLSTATYVNNWTPNDDEWQQSFIDLSDFAGFNEIRVAFVATNQNGSDFFVRNIEIFDANTQPIRIDSPFKVYPNPANDVIRVQFNLPQIEPVQVSLYDIMGRLVYDGQFDRILNQSITLYTQNENSGTYILRVESPSFKSAERIIIWH